MTTLAEAQKVRDHLLANMPDEWLTGRKVCVAIYGNGDRELAVTRYLKQMVDAGLIDHRLTPRKAVTVHEFRRLPELQQEAQQLHNEEA